MTDEEVDLDFEGESADLDVLAPDALRGSRGAVLTPGHALELGHALYLVGNGSRTAELIAEAYGLDLDSVAKLLPMPCRPEFPRYGPPTPWPVDRRAGERKDAKAPKPEPLRSLEPEVANSLVPLTSGADWPKAADTMRAKATKAGWSVLMLWGQADVAVRALVAAGEGEEKGHYETALVPTFSVSLRMEREGARAYGVWAAPSEPERLAWAYVTGGAYGVAGLKVTALGKALVAEAAP